MSQSYSVQQPILSTSTSTWTSTAITPQQAYINRNPKSSTSISKICPCTEKEIRFSFIVLVFIIGLVTYSIISFLGGIRSVKQWLSQKQQLKIAVKNYAEQTRIKWIDNQDVYSMRNEMDIYHVNPYSEPCIDDWIEYLESRRLGGTSKGYLFIIDTSGRVYVHGKATFLTTKGKNPHSHGFQNLRELDDPKSKNTPISNIIRTAKKGGGYVYYTWKKDISMIAYVTPIKGTNLILGGALPVPKNRQIKKMESNVNTLQSSHPQGVQSGMDGPMSLI